MHPTHSKPHQERERESLFAGWLEVITVYNVFCTDMIMYMDIYVYNPCITPDMKNDGVIPPWFCRCIPKCCLVMSSPFSILHLKLVSQCDRPHVHLMHTPIRTFLCWLVISEMVSLFGRVSQFSKTSTIFVAQIAPQLNHPVPVSPARSQVGLGQPWKLGLHLKPTLPGHSWKSSGNPWPWR